MEGVGPSIMELTNTTLIMIWCSQYWGWSSYLRTCIYDGSNIFRISKNVLTYSSYVTSYPGVSLAICNRVSANITLSYIFGNIFSSECTILFLQIAEECPLNYTLTVKFLLRFYKYLLSYDNAKLEILSIYYGMKGLSYNHIREPSNLYCPFIVTWTILQLYKDRNCKVIGFIVFVTWSIT